MEHEETLLSMLGLEFEAPDSGCCGMAGAFGFEAGERFEVAMAAGERVLLPAVRDAAKDTFIIADGFSCREQIRQATDRKALHTAQVLKVAIERNWPRAINESPETEFLQRRQREHGKARRKGVAFVAGTAVLLAGYWMLKHRGSGS